MYGVFFFFMLLFTGEQHFKCSWTRETTRNLFVIYWQTL